MRTVKVEVTFEDENDCIRYEFKGLPAERVSVDLDWENDDDYLFLSSKYVVRSPVLRRMTFGIDYPPVGADGVHYTVYTKPREVSSGVATLPGGNGS